MSALQLVFDGWCVDTPCPDPIAVNDDAHAERILEAMQCCITDDDYEFTARVENGADLVAAYRVSIDCVSIVRPAAKVPA